MKTPLLSRRGKWLLGLLLLLAAVPYGIMFWHAHQTSRHLKPIQRGDITRIRVWGAGMRTGEEQFCRCALVPKPERVFYESSDAKEIQSLADCIRPRLYLNLEPIVESCGQVTVDFMKGDQRAFWIHVVDRNLRSAKGLLPVSSGSREDVAEWLHQRAIPQQIAAALSAH